MTTGELLQAARKRAGLTQRALGERLGVSYQSVAQWENGLRRPKIETLHRLAQALGVEAIELVPEERQGEYVDVYMQYVKRAGAGRVPEWGGGPARDEGRGDLLFVFDRLLNEAGRREAVKRVWELALLPAYRREDGLPEPGSPEGPPEPGSPEGEGVPE